MVSDANLRGFLVKESYEITNIVFIYTEQCYGVVESLGAYASKIKYKKDGIEYEELFDNEEFVIMDEILIKHIVEE